MKLTMTEAEYLALLESEQLGYLTAYDIEAEAHPSAEELEAESRYQIPHYNHEQAQLEKQRDLIIEARQSGRFNAQT